MKIKIYLLIALLVASNMIAANSNKPKSGKLGIAKIIGTVKDDDGNILTGVNVILKNTTIGSATNVDGEFEITQVPKGEYEVVVSMIGFKSETENVLISKPGTLELNFDLVPAFYETGAVVVTGTSTPYLYEESPVKTEVVPRKVIEQTKAVNLAEALGFQTGVRVENDCQNCNFTQVRILGFEGKYSQVLVDGDPVVSTLAGVYALEQFPEAMIGQIEVVKGGGSALYGGGSIAGTINLIGRKPRLNSTTVDFLGTSMEGIMDQNVNAVAEVVSDNGNVGAFIFGSMRNRNPYDRNGDGFSELGKLNNQSVGFNWFYKPIKAGELKVSLHRIFEERRGGNNFSLPNHEADVSEALEHIRWGGKIKWQQSIGALFDYQAYASFSLLERKSYYGGLFDDDGNGEISDEERLSALNYYGATDNETYLTGARANYIAGANKITAGLEYHSDKLVDKSVRDEKYHIDEIYTNVGFYLQDDISLLRDHLNIIAGARVDKHSELSDAIISPRVNVKYEILEGLDLRASFSTGFKAPQTFDEDLHIESLGGEQRVVRNTSELKEEKSVSFSGGFEFEKFIGKIPVLFGVTGFHTTLNDAFSEVESSQSNDELILWDRINSDGAELYGVEFDFGIKPIKEVEIRGGLTYKQNEYDSVQEIFDGVFSKKFQRTPDVYGNLRVSVEATKEINLLAALRYTGTMEVPNEAIGQIIETDDTFLELDLGISYKVPLLKTIGGEVSFGAKNITDVYQDDLGVGAERDPAYLYGPQLPRRIYFGFKTVL